MYDPRQQMQRPGMPQQGGGWGQNSPWLQQLAQQAQARQAQMGPQRGPSVGPGMPGPGGVPRPMQPGPGLAPQGVPPAGAPPAGPPGGPPGGGFAANPQLMQALAQRAQAAQQAPQGGAPMAPQQGFAMPRPGVGPTTAASPPGAPANEDDQRRY